MSRETVYIVLFRGVGGATQLPTKPLREALTGAGFGNVATYINSGNAILSSDRPMSGIAAAIATIVKKEFGFEKEILMVSREDWLDLIKGNPFPEAVETPTMLHAFVLNQTPKQESVAALRAKATGTERFAIEGGVLYLHTPDGMGRSKLAAAVDRTLGVVSTARNWRTMLALMKLADEIG